jgi:IS30 family transposase
MEYRQLTQTQRYQILALRSTGLSMREVATMVGCHNSSVSRELRRNLAVDADYKPEEAQALSDARRRSALKANKRNAGVIMWIKERIRHAWSPQQIAGFMRRFWEEGIQVSHQWIYALIYRDKANGGDLWSYCRLPLSRRNRRQMAKSAGLGKIPNRVGIEARDEAIDKRQVIGHWEGDTVLKGHKDSALVTLVERRSGYLKMAILEAVTADNTAKAIVRLLAPIRGAVKTITFDNGSEFAAHETVSKALTAKAFFCDPYMSCQRGTNENTNGLIRQYFPKGTDFSQLRQSDIRKVENALNGRPRFRLGFRTPAEIFLGEYSGVLETSGAALTA